MTPIPWLAFIKMLLYENDWRGQGVLSLITPKSFRQSDFSIALPFTEN